MKKVFLTAAVLLVGLSFIARSETVKVPHGDSVQALITADYGGVQYSTAAFFVGTATVAAQGKGVFYGVIFTSGTSIDFVDVFDGTTTLNATAISAITRLYNVNASTGGVGAFAAGFSGTVRPMRFYRGLYIRPSTAIYNGITSLYYSEQDANKK